MEKLNLPEYSFKIISQEDKLLIFDAIRKKYVALTAEEWVRQNFIRYLISEKKYPQQLIAVEKALLVNQLNRRSDIIVHDNSGKPRMIVECKAPSVTVTQAVFDQIARYNIPLKVDVLIVTNGLIHFCCYIDHEKKEHRFVREIPDFSQL